MALPHGFTLIAELFDPASSAAYLEGLLTDIDWEEHRFTIYGRTIPMPRLIAMYGPVGYHYSGVVHPSRPLLPRLEFIRRRVEERTGRAFNSVLANLYRDGRDSVGWHRDSDYAHGGQPDIASVSFGARRRFEIRDRGGRVRAAIDLESGSLLLITGEAVKRWWHQVPKMSGPVGPRVNLTFRHMVVGGRGMMTCPARARDRLSFSSSSPGAAESVGSLRGEPAAFATATRRSIPSAGGSERAALSPSLACAARSGPGRPSRGRRASS